MITATPPKTATIVTHNGRSRILVKITAITMINIVLLMVSQNLAEVIFSFRLLFALMISCCHKAFNPYKVKTSFLLSEFGKDLPLYLLDSENLDPNIRGLGQIISLKHPYFSGTSMSLLRPLTNRNRFNASKENRL